jgi:UDP-N-acetylmuramoyl-tripeptide--D-alanyl-D-alanine ligase
MKSSLRSVLATLLAAFARAIVRKYGPTIIMVTGSVGKTSTKDAVAAAFKKVTDVRASEKSYNSELGVPLTIIGAKNPWESFSKWWRVFVQAYGLLLFTKPYPKLLILEVGADRPGDLSRILRIAIPHAVVVTRLPDVPVHVEAYTSTQAVKDEEFTPAYSLAPGAPLILDSDNEYALEMGAKTLASMTTFGFSPSADVSLSNVSVVVEKGRATGMSATITVDGETHPLTITGALGAHQFLAPAAALATARSLGVPVSKSLAGLHTYRSPLGRSHLLRGIHGSVLIDDSYNSSPAAAEEALTSLGVVPATGRKIAVLGDMLELGRYSVNEHTAIGTKVAAVCDELVVVGVRSRATGEAARAAGLPLDKVHFFDTALGSVPALQGLIKEGDVVLIKGSQGMRMERVVEALLERKDDVQYLVRQEKEWKRR